MHKSEGHAGVLTAQDAEDYYDLIEWAAQQPWSSGPAGDAQSIGGGDALTGHAWVPKRGRATTIICSFGALSPGEPRQLSTQVVRPEPPLCWPQLS